MGLVQAYLLRQQSIPAALWPLITVTGYVLCFRNHDFHWRRRARMDNWRDGIGGGCCNGSGNDVADTTKQPLSTVPRLIYYCFHDSKLVTMIDWL